MDTCSYCGSFDHNHKYCPKRGSSSNNSFNSTFEMIKCSYCNNICNITSTPDHANFLIKCQYCHEQKTMYESLYDKLIYITPIIGILGTGIGVILGISLHLYL